MRAELRVGTKVYVRRHKYQPDSFFGIVSGYDLHHSKYRVRRVVAGWNRSVLCEHDDWAFPGQVSATSEV